MKNILIFTLILHFLIEAKSNDYELESNLEQALKEHNIDIPETNETEELIKDISEELLDKIIKTNPNVFIYFYTTFCTTCQEFSYIIEDVAQKSKELNLNVQFIKLDSVKYPSASENFVIQEYPSSFLIRNSTLITPFDKEKTYENILEFIQTHIESSSNSNLKSSLTEVVSDINTLNNLIQSLTNKHIFLYLGDDTLFESLKHHISRGKDTIVFYSNSSDILSKYSVRRDQYELIHFRYSKISNTYHEKRLGLSYRSVKPEIIKDLIFTSIKNQVSRLTSVDLDRILDSGFPSILLVLQDFSNETSINHYKELMNTVRKKHPSDMWYFIANYNDTNVKFFIDLLRINQNMLPYVLIFDGSGPKDSELKKFIWNRESSIDVDNLNLFVQDFYNKSLTNYLASEDVPTQPINQHGVYKIVRHTFSDVVLNSSGKEILLLLCTGYHDDCPILLNRYNNLGDKLKNNEKLLIATLDPSINEIDNLNLNAIPYLMFLPDVSDKINNHTRFEGNFTTKEMVQFVMNETIFPPLNEIQLENESDLQLSEEKVFIKRKNLEEDHQSYENSNSKVSNMFDGMGQGQEGDFDINNMKGLEDFEALFQSMGIGAGNDYSGSGEDEVDAEDQDRQYDSIEEDDDMKSHEFKQSDKQSISNDDKEIESDQNNLGQSISNEEIKIKEDL